MKNSRASNWLKTRAFFMSLRSPSTTLLAVWGLFTWRWGKRYQDKIRNYMDRRVTPPWWVTSPTWGPLPPYKQVLRVFFQSPAPNFSPLAIESKQCKLSARGVDYRQCQFSPCYKGLSTERMFPLLSKKKKE